MKLTTVVCLIPAFVASALAQVGLPEKTEDILVNRLQLKSVLQKNLTEELQDTELPAGDSKSVGRAVIYSAVLPGAGQFYAKSYLKAALFVAVEATAWTINITNNNKGDDKTAEFESFADQNWSEQRYWSHVYLQLKDRDIRDFPNYDDFLDYSDPDKPVLTNWQDAEQTLKNYDNSTYLLGYTHELPETKTQQYYEMIGKYPEQFGNAWEDASYFANYNGYQNHITALNDRYANMRNEANDFYERAGYGSMIALVNHLVSAIDAGFTTRKYNERQLRLTYHQKRYEEENVNMFGLSIDW